MSMSSKIYNPVSIIRKKRDGNILDKDEIVYLVEQYTHGNIPDYQMSAFLMAAFLNGLNAEEASSLTSSMLNSGEVLDLSDIPGKKVDKHSTGGVGDKLSLILAPIVASCGVPVPMIAGRGLGHTGGTLDKLESIPGFTVDITLSEYRRILKKHNLVIAGQTREIAPADKRLYALRDVTATVESIPLIAGSIMSKKLAEGIDALVLDVKYGSGAFMNKIEEALELAKTLVAIGESFGKETIAYLTHMDQPLGYNIGNWLEVEEAIEALKGKGPKDVMEVTHLLAGTMIYLGEQAGTTEEGIEMSKEAIQSGRAWNKWLELVREQGGDTAFLKNPGRYARAEHQLTVTAPETGYLQAIDAYAVGMAALELGAGRRTKESTIDPPAGVKFKKKVGDYVEKDETIAIGFTNNYHMADAATELLTSALSIGKEPPAPAQMVTYKVNKTGLFQLKDKSR